MEWDSVHRIHLKSNSNAGDMFMSKLFAHCARSVADFFYLKLFILIEIETMRERIDLELYVLQRFMPPKTEQTSADFIYFLFARRSD